jgi:hypothetical protein
MIDPMTRGYIPQEHGQEANSRNSTMDRSVHACPQNYWVIADRVELIYIEKDLDRHTSDGPWHRHDGLDTLRIPVLWK